MMSTDSLILDLSADLRPVRPRSVRLEVLALLALAIVEAALVTGLGAMRHDMPGMMATPLMMWKSGGLALLAVTSCWLALQSFVPPASVQRGLKVCLILAGLLVVGGFFVTSDADSNRSLYERLAPTHGLMCLLAIVVLSLPVMAALGFVMRRAAPVHPRRSALCSGVAASTCGALIFTLCCPSNDPLYIIAWYSLAVAVVAFTARWLLPRRFRL